ncbi:MAG: ribosome-associated translation inhibitor RaiA [Duncaniella sp.]|nr:ribosome-associated translation inhibitor RaiA [Duncaniella sp.]
METNIKAIHFDINDRLTAFINKKTERLVRRFPAIATADFTLKVVKPETSMNKEAVIRIAVPHIPDVVADKTADTFEEAIDLGLEAIEKQLEKQKEKQAK